MINGYKNKQLKSQKLKLNADILGGMAGQTITVKTQNGIPVDRNVRRHLKDAEFDNCCELVATKGNKKKEKEKDSEVK